MTDITTVYIAVVTGAFTAIGATTSQVIAAFQSGKQAKRSERAQFTNERREACMRLLQSAADLRTQVANNHSDQGSELAPRLELVRKHAAATKLSAVSLALLVPEPLGSIAAELAREAALLAMRSEQHPKRPPDFTELDKCVDTFTVEAMRSKPR